MMVTWVRGLFKDVHGSMEFDYAHPLGATFEGEMDATKLWTGESNRDEHLRNADFFDVENHPAITFKGRVNERTGDTHFKALAELTMRGETREVSLDVAYLGQWETPTGSATRTGAPCAGSASRPRPSSTAMTSACPGRTSCRAVALW